MRGPSRWWLLAALGALLVLLLPAGLRLKHRLMPPFNRKVWLSGQGVYGPSNPRRRMVRSLLRTQHLNGKTRAEILTLLGPPDGVGLLSGAPHKPSDTQKAAEFDYVIGVSYFDPEFLTLHFDQQGRVFRWSHWQS